jgi:hypothetical protein
MKRFLDWIVKTMELLSMLQQHLTSTIQAWERFNAADGDIAYFSDIEDLSARLCLENIREAFNELLVLERRLSHLRESCRETANHVSTSSSFFAL